jgi:hypothetical protein
MTGFRNSVVEHSSSARFVTSSIGLLAALIAAPSTVSAQSGTTAKDSLEVDRLQRAFHVARISPDSLTRYRSVTALADSLLAIARADSLSGLRARLVHVMYLRAVAAAPVIRHDVALAEREKSCELAQVALRNGQKASIPIPVVECQDCFQPFLAVIGAFERADSVTRQLCR